MELLSCTTPNSWKVTPSELKNSAAVPTNVSGRGSRLNVVVDVVWLFAGMVKLAEVITKTVPERLIIL
jgi:hypothetical protein